MKNIREVKEKLLIYEFTLNNYINSFDFGNEKITEILQKAYNEVTECQALVEQSDKSIYELSKIKLGDMINEKMNIIDTLISEFYITYMGEMLKNIKNIYLAMLDSKKGFSLEKLKNLLYTIEFFIPEFESYKNAIKSDMLNEYELITNDLSKMSEDINNFIENISNELSLK